MEADHRRHRFGRVPDPGHDAGRHRPSAMCRRSGATPASRASASIPVKGAPDAELQFAADAALDEQGALLRPREGMAHLHRPSPKGLRHAAAFPSWRPTCRRISSSGRAEYEALKNLLLTPDRSQPVAITTALTGAGGFGKTTLAAALCHDEDIMENFDDGILWVTLGQTPDVLGSAAHHLRGADRRAARVRR